MCSVRIAFILFVTAITYQSINGTGANGAGGQVIVLHCPKSLKLLENFGKRQEMLKELYSAVLGFPTPQEDYRNLISFIDPFDTPEAIVEVYITGVSDIGPFYGSYKTYSMSASCDSDSFEYVTAKITKIHSRLGRSKQVKIRLNDKHDLQLHNDLTYAVKNLSEFHTSILSHSDPTTKQLFQELNVLHGIIAALKNNSIKRDYLKDFFHFQVNSLQPIEEKYGSISAQALEAKRLLHQQLEGLREELVKAYDGDVLITVVASENDPVGCKRKERQVTMRSENKSGEWKKRNMNGNQVARDVRKTVESEMDDVERDKRMTDETGSQDNADARSEWKTESERNDADRENSKTGQKVSETIGIKEWTLVEPKPKHRPIDSEIDKTYKYVLRQDDTPKAPSKPAGIETPIIFQIMFWTCFALSFTLIAIVQVFMTLDPGRDSIVYRLTDNLISKKTE